MDQRGTHADVSRAAPKLAAALDAFALNPAGWVCADLGSNVGGFVQTLLDRGAQRVYAVERGYGVLSYKLRHDPRVVVRERTDALRLYLPEPADLVTIDMGWTRQAHILPVAVRLLRPRTGRIISLIKPHYESSEHDLVHGVLPPDAAQQAIRRLRGTVANHGLELLGEIISPIKGQGGNTEFLWHLRPRANG